MLRIPWSQTNPQKGTCQVSVYPVIGVVAIVLFGLCNAAYASDWSLGFDRFDALEELEPETYDTVGAFGYASFDTEADFESARFDSIALFRYTKFAALVSFAYASFGTLASFGHARFGSLATFWSARFDSLADFRNARFDSLADFRLASFDTLAFFRNARFDKGADFGEVRFASEAYFGDAGFASESNFSSVRFESVADFSGAAFDSVANFGYASFDSLTSFRNTSFGSMASFRRCNFHGYTDFDGVILPDTLNFSEIKNIKHEIDLSDAELSSAKSICRINLLRTDIAKIRMKYGRMFRLYFPPNTSFERKSNVYQSLLSKLNNDGFAESYKTLDIEYRQATYRHEGSSFKSWFLGVWWNYGYNREYIFWWIAGLVGFFSAINILAYNYFREHVYSVKSLERLRDNRGYLKPQQLRHRIFDAILYTCIIFFGFKFDPDGLKNANPCLAYIALVYSSGFICLGYLASFILK